MRIRTERDHRGLLLRCFSRGDGEVAYARVGLGGPKVEIEFPSEWHERCRAWVRLGIGVASMAFSFPWSKVAPDQGQCSGPRYGFYFFEDHLVLMWGQDTGRRGAPHKFIYMPWSWTHRKHEVLSEPEEHDYAYRLRGGDLQQVRATIKIERRTWTRCWIPWRRSSRYIDVAFSGEVGERSGSWKGGVLGCSFNMRDDETAVQALRRMERERRFT